MINEKRLLNTFLKIVSIDSPSGFEQGMVAYVSDYLNSLKYKIQIDSYGNLICKIPGEKNSTLLLTAHLDTVEPGCGIIPLVEDGVVKSVGNTILGADNKVGVACLLEVAHTISENNIEHPSLELVFTLSEEVGNYGALNLNYSLLTAKEGFSFDGSDTFGAITVASPFYNRFDISLEGTASHAGKPEGANNVIMPLLNVLNSINLGRITDNTLCNIGVVALGTTRNTVPGKVEVKGEVRSYTEAELNKYTDLIVGYFQSSAQKFNATVSCDVVRENGGFKLSESDRLLSKGVATLEKLNIKPILHESTGCYDANIFFDHGIKVLNFSNGSKNNHTIEEEVSVENLSLTAKLAFNLVLS
ncbi:MAG: M20/M25/M40 family metallo-hydrolase [Patescibacteria group bacterium]